MAAAQHQHSYWEPDEASATTVASIALKPVRYTKEDIVWHAWTEICATYFPRRTPPGGGPKYSIQREAYRGLPPGQELCKPDIVVVRFIATLQQRGLPTISTQRDCLWIECKAPCEDQPNGWNGVISEAALRLAISHPTRMIYLIAAVGLKWMIFRWDPTVPSTNPPLEVIKHSRHDSWTLDPRIHPLPGEKYVLQGPNGRLIIDSTLAHSLDYWTLDSNGISVHLDVNATLGATPDVNSKNSVPWTEPTVLHMIESVLSVIACI